MNCFNASDYILESLESALNQSYQNLEIIIWDNGSSEDIKSLIDNFTNDQRIRFFRNEHNETLGKARNRAIDVSKGDYIAFLDCDDLWLENKIEQQVHKFSEDKETGLVFTDAYFFDEKGVGKQIYKKQNPPTGYVFGGLLSNYFLVMSTVMIKREVLDQMDEYFDQSYEIIEEYEFFLRISKIWKLDYCHDVLGMWRMHSKSTTFTKSHLIAREKQDMLKKFTSIYKNFSNDFEDEIEVVKQKISMTKALNFFYNGENEMARNEIRQLIFNNKKALVYYIGTYMPVTLFVRVYRFFTGTMPV
ncbi:glycosyltransferase [Gammaproteobacteria bacterium]|nr:glycosyltransferase [Gammaproteobacteria bacterium]